MSGSRLRNTGLPPNEHFKDNQTNDSDKHLDVHKFDLTKNVDPRNPDKRIYIEPEYH